MSAASPTITYERRRPEQTTLYRVVQENLETLYGAVDEGAVSIALPGFVRKELEGYLGCGLLCRGFARLRCDGCEETRLVAFACKGRGFCPSCLGRKMSATAANLTEHVVPAVPLRQWVLTVPFAWRKRLAYDGRLWSGLVRIFVRTVLGFYAKRGKKEDGAFAQSGAVVALQRTSSDLKLNPHVHAVFLDGAYAEAEGGELVFRELGHLQTRQVAEVLEQTRDKMVRYLRRRGLLDEDDSDDEGHRGDGLCALAASAVAGTAPPAGPEWRRGRKLGLEARAVRFEGELSVSLDGFTLHARTRAGAEDERGREALLKYILRPAVAQERITHGPEGLVRIALKKAFSDGTVAVDLDPLSLLCRLAAAVPPPKMHTVRYAGVLASASPVRPQISPAAPASEETSVTSHEAPEPRGFRYRPWAELLRRTFALDVLACPKCEGRMRLLAMVTDDESVRRYLRALGEPTDVPARSPARGPPFWASRALRRTSDEAAE